MLSWVTSSSSRPSTTKTCSKMCLSVICLLFILMDGAYGFGSGNCPKYPSMKNFDFPKLEGGWYGFKKTLQWLEYPAGCIFLGFRYLKTNQFRLMMGTLSERERIISFYIGFVKPENNETSKVYLEIDNKYAGEYQVLDADYKNFAILWSCNSWGSWYNSDQIWVISRHSEVPAEVAEQIDGILNKLGLDPHRLVLSNTMCFL